MYIQEESKFNNAKIYIQKWVWDGITGEKIVDSHWKIMNSWVGMKKLVSYIGYIEPTLLAIYKRDLYPLLSNGQAFRIIRNLIIAH